MHKVQYEIWETVMNESNVSTDWETNWLYRGFFLRAKCMKSCKKPERHGTNQWSAQTTQGNIQCHYSAKEKQKNHHIQNLKQYATSPLPGEK